MAFNFSGGTVNVSGNVTSVPSKIVPLIAVVENQSGANDTTMLTVAGGQKVTILSIHVSAHENAAGTDVVSVYSGATNTGSLLQIALKYAAETVNRDVVYPYSQAPVLAAGATLKFKTTGNVTQSHCSVTYYSEAA